MIRSVAVVLLVCIFFGCSSSMQRTYPSVERSHLWTAMIASADSPEYSSEDFRKRWIVLENEVELNPRQGQIDVKRIIHRSLQLPRQRAQRDRKDVSFSVYLLPTNPPTIEFISHNSTYIPVHNLNESERYFDAVEALLVPVID